ncbi:hypothetical protein CTI12_AA251530 [Artemisia annua]|uniref:Uncharacterized protein n=1 Tax=Artemisia annua TaxID=35608 RepID=A0A2U1NLR2_ARTAN|nr:hypothetical protein CTI12_AA251530 [Artemisia annua]
MAIDDLQREDIWDSICGFSGKTTSKGWNKSSATTPDSPAFLKDKHQETGINQVLQRPDFPAFLKES